MKEGAPRAVLGPLGADMAAPGAMGPRKGLRKAARDDRAPTDAAVTEARR